MLTVYLRLGSGDRMEIREEDGRLHEQGPDLKGEEEQRESKGHFQVLPC